MRRWRRCSRSDRDASGPRPKRAIGHGGIALVERATGISRSTIQRGLRELGGRAAPAGTDAQKRGERKRATALDTTLLGELDALVEPTATTSATPSSPNCCTSWGTACKET
jgi:hypothetical protein